MVRIDCMQSFSVTSSYVNLHMQSRLVASLIKLSVFAGPSRILLINCLYRVFLWTNLLCARKAVVVGRDVGHDSSLVRHRSVLQI